MDRHSRRLRDSGLRGQAAPGHRTASAAGAGHGLDRRGARRRAAQRQLRSAAGRHGALRGGLPVHSAALRRAGGQHAPGALARRRLLGARLHLLGPHVPGDGHVGARAVAQPPLPVHLLHRSGRRPDAARRTRRRVAARPGVDGALRRLTAPRPPASEAGGDGSNVLGEVVI